MSADLMTPPAATTPSASTADGPPRDQHLTVIEARPGWQLVDFRELAQYRDLLWFLTWRGIKVLYAQSALGIGWAVLQPLLSMLVFSVIFGTLAKLPSDGIPYPIFSLAALVPWTYFSNALNGAANSLVNQSQMISKVYFPRIILPLAEVLGKLVDLSISLTLLAGLMAWYGVVPNANILALPLLLLIMVGTSAGLGMWLTSLAIQFRDVKHAMSFLTQFIMYASPVVYSTTLIPERYRWIYAINPLVGVIEGFRAALLSSRPMPWDWIAIGSVSALVIFCSGLAYFRRQERLFADVA